MDIRIQKVGDSAKEAFVELKKIQQGEKPIVKTGEEYVDCHIGGLLPGDVWTIAGASGTGKSETLYTVLDKIMSREVNPTSDNYVSLEFSFEMKMLNKLLRQTHNLLGKKKSEILSSPFDDSEKTVVKNYFDGLKDDRRFVCQSPVTSDEFYKMAREFCLEHAGKEAVIISVDHLLLFAGSDKQLVLEKVSEAINLLKIEFPNVYFILLSQLNRNNPLMAKDKDNSLIPTNSMLFGSSFMEHLSAYITIIVNPFKAGINQFLRVNENRYPWLDEYFTAQEKGKVSFKTLGNLFYFMTKVRESDNAYRNLFVVEMDLSEEQRARMEAAVIEETPVIPVNIPSFDQTSFNTSALQNAQGASFNEEGDDSPF